MARICIIVDFRIKPGHYDAFNAHIRAHAAATLAEEPGCLTFDVTQPLTEDGAPDKSRIMLVEIYRDQAAFDIHRNGPRMLYLIFCSTAPVNFCTEAQDPQGCV